MPTFETPEPISVTVELGVGDARITASDRTDTVVEVRPRNESKASDIKAAEQTRVEYAGGRLLVKAPKWRQYSPFSSGGSIDVTIDLPTGSRLGGDTSLGEFRCEGRLGECRLKTAMGNILLDRADALHLNASYGDVTVGRAAGDVDVTTGSGEVRIRAIEGTAVIKNSNGDTNVGEVTGDLRVKAANGDISIDRAHTSVSAKSAIGDIRIGEVIRGTIVLETAMGVLEIGIQEGTAAWLDVSSQYGSVHNALDAADGPHQSEETVEVRARSAYGDIVIDRSTHVENIPNETRKT